MRNYHEIPKAPPRGDAHHVLREDREKAMRHLNSKIAEHYHPGAMQHLGGTSAFISHLDNASHGEAHAIKKELKQALDYLFYYATTGHGIYRYLADDRLEHIHYLCKSISCEKERAHAMHFLHITREYMTHIDENKGSHATMPASGGRVTL